MVASKKLEMLMMASDCLNELRCLPAHPKLGLITLAENSCQTMIDVTYSTAPLYLRKLPSLPCPALPVREEVRNFPFRFRAQPNVQYSTYSPAPAFSSPERGVS